MPTLVLSAGLLPQGVLQFADANGVPLAGGSVTYYQPNSTVLSPVWADPYKSVQLSNPVTLDSAGRPQTGGAECEVYGDAQYSMLVLDAYGNTVYGPSLTQDPWSLIQLGIAPLQAEIAGLGGTQFQIVPNVPALRALTVASPSGFYYLQGWTSTNDGGQGIFEYVPSDDTSADNSGTIFVDAGGHRIYRQSEGQPYNVLWFAGNGATDFAPGLAALSAVVSDNPNTPAKVYFPAITGGYTIKSAVNWTLPGTGQFSITFSGDGADVSVLNFQNCSGFLLGGNSGGHSFHFMDLTFATNALGSANFTAVYCANATQGGALAQNDFTRVTFRGTDGGGATFAWSQAIYIVGWSNINYTGCSFFGPSAANAGIGIYALGSASGGFKYSLIHNITSCSFFSMAIGVQYGDYVQGMTIDGCNFTNGTTDIYTPASAMHSSQLAIVRSQFAGLVGSNGARVLLDGPFPSLQMSDNLLFIGPNQLGIAVNNILTQSTFAGNNFSGILQSGVQPVDSFGILINGSGDGVITGNSFFGLTNGVSLVGATSGWTVGLNIYPGTINNVINPGSNNVGVITP